jgi:glycosyltransferase involved in cell wall biosynthesis
VTAVSVVIPVKDDAELLRRCLELLSPQLRQEDELIVVDNGSTDDSATVARAFGAVVIDRPGGGIPAAAAAGYDAARCAVIARLDADCVPPATWLHRIRLVMERESTDAVTGSAEFIDGPRWLRRVGCGLYVWSYYLAVGAALGHVPLFGSNCAFRRSAWAAVSAVVHRDDELVHDDLDLSFHLGTAHRVRYAAHVRMGISSRPFTDPRSLVLRARRGMHSVLIHWPEEFPPLRWARSVAS